MTPREISTHPEIATGPHFHLQHGTKTTPVVLSADREVSWLLLALLVYLLSGGTVQTENSYSCIPAGDRSALIKPKSISINTNHSYHQRSFPYASLSRSNKKIRFSFNQSNKKRWGVWLVNLIKHLPHKVFLLWHDHEKNGQPRLKRHLSPWFKTDPTGYQPSISMSDFNVLYLRFLK